MNVLFFPFYLVALPGITLWNAVPNAFLIWAVVKDMQEKQRTALTADMDYYQTIGSALMLFLDSSFYIVPGFMIFVGSSVGVIVAAALLAVLLAIAGVSTPIILYALGTCLVLSWTGLAAIALLATTTAPLWVGAIGLFFLIPWIMW